MVEVEDGKEGVDEDWGNCTGEGGLLHSHGTFAVVIWEQKLVGDGGHDEITIGTLSPGIQTDCADDVATYD